MIMIISYILSILIHAIFFLFFLIAAVCLFGHAPCNLISCIATLLISASAATAVPYALNSDSPMESLLIFCCSMCFSGILSSPLGHYYEYPGVV